MVIKPHPNSSERSPETPMTSFSATCSRLSQYLRDQRRLASVTRPTTTMSLLSELDVTAETEEETGGVASNRQPLDLFPQHPRLSVASVPAKEKSQLTIFYGGQMVVFHDFPPDKADDLMLMAEKMSSVDPPVSNCGTTGLPQKRRASLHRFMERRRDRINTSRKPYQMEKSRTKSSSDKPVAGLPLFLQNSQTESKSETIDE